MAAQERAKLAQQAKAGTTPPPPAASKMAPPAMDFLTSEAPPTTTASAPPAFDDAFSALAPPPAPPVMAPPPPTFDDNLLFSPPMMAPPSDLMAPPSFQWDPHAPAPLLAPQAPPMVLSSPPSASAPSYEDLMDYQHQENQQQHMPWEPMAPPPMSSTQESEDEDVMAAILALEGLSPAEKESMIAEQRKIMAAIEGSKKNSQQSAADAFEQRSLQAAVGANRRVTDSASAIPPELAAAMTDAELEQMKADIKLAEQLQQEEYENAERENRQQQSARSATRTNGTAVSPRSRAAAAPESSAASGQGWMEWLGLSSTPAAAAALAPSSAAAAKRDRERLIEGDTGSSTAMVAGPAPLFACVTDSISQAATYALSPSLSQDEEGNVHGVDSSSLLAVTQVGRKSNNPDGGNPGAY